jgi:hypothetical protein
VFYRDDEEFEIAKSKLDHLKKKFLFMKK